MNPRHRIIIGIPYLFEVRILSNLYSKFFSFWSFVYLTHSFIIFFAVCIRPEIEEEQSFLKLTASPSNPDFILIFFGFSIKSSINVFSELMSDFFLADIPITGIPSVF